MLISDLNSFLVFKTWAATQHTIALDIETSGLEYKTGARVIGIGVSSATKGFYLPVAAYNTTTEMLCDHPSALYLREFLQIIEAKNLVCFNGAFDLGFIKQQYGLDLVPKLHTDVLLLKHTVDEEFPFKLKEIAVQVFGYAATSQQRDLIQELKDAGASKNEIYKATWPTIGKYCIQDCVLTYRLMNHYLPKLRSEGLQDFFYIDEVMPLYKEVVIPMQAKGIKIDESLMRSSLASITADIAALEAKIQSDIAPFLGIFEDWFLNKDYAVSRSGNFAQGIVEYAGLDLPKTASGKFSLATGAIQKLPDSHFKQVLLKQEYLAPEHCKAVQKLLSAKDHGPKPLFNLQSKHHLKKLFFDTLKETPLSTTDLGSPQVNDDFLDTMAIKYAWAYDLHVYNRLQKLKATYIERFLDKAIDGVFYPSFQQHRTVSGRLAGDFQQLPRPIEGTSEHPLVVKYVNLIRQFFIARENCVFVDADYNSAEPRVFAHVSGDQGLQRIFTEGLDFYSEIAIRTEGLPYSSKKGDANYLGLIAKSKRQDAKAYSLGIPYGMSGYKLAFQLNIDTQSADKLVQKYLEAFPKLKKWMDDTQAYVLQHGYIKSLGGRIRHLPRAIEYSKKFGVTILDSLQLYKDFHHDENLYEHMKGVRRELKNLINNANNFQIQSYVASIINRASIGIARELAAKGIDAHILAQIHDQLVVECSSDYSAVVSEIVQRHMETTVQLSLPLPATPNIGSNLSDSKG